MSKEKPIKDHHSHGKNYIIRIPKEDIQNLIKKELNKLYPNFTEMKKILAEQYNLFQKLRELENKINSIQ